MQSRKSSILKPRKVREPLQDLNQLLPNNDDEETTTTDAQRRRVSFASMNKVKEYETASECVAAINAPPPVYEKRYSLSTDLHQPPILGKIATETYQTTAVSRKSIQNTFKANPARLSVADENIYIEEDVELTETIGRIYDIPMKSSGDSSMETTHVVSHSELHYDERSEGIGAIMGPLNLTKENLSQTGSFADAHIEEIEIVKIEKDADTSSMETTEVIRNEIQIENPDSGTLSMETTEVIRNNVIRVERPNSFSYGMDTTEIISPSFDKNENNSSMETTEVIYDNLMTESLKSQSVCFETLQSSQAVDDSANPEEDIEYISVRNFESPSALPKRKSIFEMSSRPLKNWDGTQLGTLHADKSNCSSVKLVGGDDSKLAVCNDSLSLTCHEMVNRIDSITNVQMLSQEVEQRLNITNEPAEEIVEEVKFNNGIVKTSTQETNKTKYSVSSMQLLSQKSRNQSLNVSSLAPEKSSCNDSKIEQLTRDNKTKCNNSNMELLTQEDKTKCNNSNMELLTQEENKTKYTNSSMELASQEDNKTKYNNSNMELLTQEKTKSDEVVLQAAKNEEPSDERKSCFRSSIIPSVTDKPPEEPPITPMKSDFSESAASCSKIVASAVDSFSEHEFMSEPAGAVSNADPRNMTQDQNELPHETTLRSSQGDDSSANDSNSPLTVGVNFSIFQKNKETRVEFSGTIDSSKKKKSISNVKVNIINNKTEKSNKRVKELRFSMPATTKVSHESEAHKPEFSATFTDFSIPNEDPLPPLGQEAEESHSEKANVECPATESAGIVTLNSSTVLNEDLLNTQLAKPVKKRLSNDAFQDVDEETCSKRRSLVAESVSPAGTESSGSSGAAMRRSFTEIKQRRESFVSEEKSFLAIDDMLVETCSRSTYQTHHVSVAHHEQTSPSADFSVPTGSLVGDNGSKVDSTEPAGGASLNESHGDSINQSSQEELNDYLHNPSIIVNVGDSFSHYKSMDLGTDVNVSASDVRESVADENDAKPVIDYIDSDDVSKENLVAEWLQNKTGKTNLDTRLFSSSSDSSSQSTVKSVRDKSNAGDAVRMVQSCTMKGAEVKVDDAKQEPVDSEVSEAKEELPSDSPNASIVPEIPEETAVAGQVDDKMETNVEDNSTSEATPQTEETPAEADEQLPTEPDRADPVVSCTDFSDPNEDSEPMELFSRDNESNFASIDEPVQLPNVSSAVQAISCSEKVTLPKSTSKTRLSVDPVFVSSELTSEKRQKMSPEFEQSEMETEEQIETCSVPRIKPEIEPVVERKPELMDKSEAQPASSKNKVPVQQGMRPRDVFKVAGAGLEGKSEPKKADTKQHRPRRLRTTRKDILEKIESLLKNGNQKWKLKVASEDEWVFQFFFDQLELIIKFDNDESSNTCSALCQYVQPPNIKYYEICKIAVEYVIRKNESKLKKIFQTVEDVPYLLKLMEPDIIYIQNFVADILQLCDSEIFKIKNGRAVFYIYSFKNIMSAKIQVNISRLERLSVKDIHVEEIVGKANLNLIRNTFTEAGRDYDFFSKFVNKLWTVLDE